LISKLYGISIKGYKSKVLTFLLIQNIGHKSCWFKILVTKVVEVKSISYYFIYKDSQTW